MIKKIKDNINDDDFREILLKGFSFLLLRIVGFIAGYVFIYLIAKNFGASINGLVTLSFTFILSVSIIGRLGLDLNLVRFFSIPKNKNNSRVFIQSVTVSFFFSLVLALVLYLVRDIICIKFFNKPQLIPYFKWVAITIPLWSVVLVCGGLFRGLKKNILYALFNNSGRFLFALAFFSFFLLNDLNVDELLPIKVHFYGILVLAIIILILSLRYFRRQDQFDESSDKFKIYPFLRESYPIMISEATLLFLVLIDTIILGVFESDSTIGVYNVAFKIAVITVFSLQAINSILAPKIAQSYQSGNKDNCQKMITFSTNLNVIITFFILASIILFHKKILAFFGEEFLTGTLVLLILCFGQLISSLSGSVGVTLQMTGNQKKFRDIVVITLALNLIFNLILTPKYGSVGTAISTVISLAFRNITGAIYLRKKTGLISYFNIGDKGIKQLFK